MNEAYSTLSDPFRRGEYLLALRGGPSATESREMTPAFLEEMLDLRMEIEELRERNSADSPARLALEEQLRERAAGLLREVADCFAEIETNPSGDERKQPLLLLIRQALNATRYINGLLRDLQEDE